MVVKVTKKANKNHNWTAIRINVNGKIIDLTVYEDSVNERVLVHGNSLGMPIRFGCSTQMVITKTDENGHIKEINVA